MQIDINRIEQNNNHARIMHKTQLRSSFKEIKSSKSKIFTFKIFIFLQFQDL